MMQRLVEKLSEKKSYPESINYIRSKISFALLASSILCIGGGISLRKVQFINNSIMAIVEEVRLRQKNFTTINLMLIYDCVEKLIHIGDM